LRRECLEELGARVSVTERLGPDLTLSPTSVLRVYLAALEPGSAEPAALEHVEVRWVGAAELPALDWLEADRVLLPELALLLA
jgi:8-oxo-dGTP diphosphatase